MNRFLIILAVSTAMTAPAFAETMAKDMACSEFSAMDSAGMMAAMDEAKMAPDAMASGDAMAPDAMASGDAMASDDAMAMTPEDEMAALVKTCNEHPDMMVMEAMHPKM